MSGLLTLTLTMLDVALFLKHLGTRQQAKAPLEQHCGFCEKLLI